MADNESDLETDGLELALDTLCHRHCSNESFLNSKDYCSEFCELVEEYTGQWQVPLPQLKVLRTALCSFTSATAAFPDDCQHVHYVLSSLALSFFELMLFFSKEEFVEEPLKDILDAFQECHSQLLRHRNIYLQHVKQIIKGGGPWEHPVLQGILKEADLPQNEVEDFLSSELPIFLELRVRYLQACERMQEAMALAKSSLENQEAGKHLYFHQAYLTCLYKASLYENLHKEMAEIDGRDAVEIICNTESVEKDELLLSMCKAFLTRQLQNGDMYYIWDLVFIWSRLYLRAHPSRQGFLTECLQLASTATNVRAIFPFIKLVTTELGAEGVQVCAELCARALQLCDMQADAVAQSLVCKTIAFLLPHDLEMCRACALLVFCQERSLEAYRTVCLLYMHPDQEPHPHNSPVRTNVRFHIMQMLKERLCFDPEFWNLLTLRTYCLELMSDNVMKDAVLSEIKEEEEKGYIEEALPNNCINRSCILGINICHCNQAALVKEELQEKESVNGAERKCVAPNNSPLNRRKWRKSLRSRTHTLSDDELELGDDPDIKYNLKSTSLDNKPVYSLRHNHTTVENSTSGRVPLNRKREYLSRCVKSQILKRKGRKKRWLQGIPRLEQIQTVKEKKIKIKGKKRGRKPLSKLELSFPDNEINLTEETGNEEKMDMEDKEHDMPYLEAGQENKSKKKENVEHLNDPVRENGENANSVCGTSLSEQSLDESQIQFETKLSEDPHCHRLAADPATEASHELDGPLLELLGCPVELWHNYSLNSKNLDSEKPETPESQASDEVNGNAEEEPQPEVETEVPKTEVKIKRTWRDRVIRSQKYSHLIYHCKFCLKTYKGLNVMRHALSHLKSRNLRCVLCGKRFKKLPLAKKHVLEHIDEMCKQKPPDKEPCAEEPPAANGIMDNVENQCQPQNACQASVAQDETAGQKSKGRTKVSSLNREERIIRNVRTLLKKTAATYKKSKNPDTNVIKQLDFKDEQVVITDGLVVIKDLPLIKMKEEGEEKETAAGENGCSVDIKYQLCPSESCDKVFLRISSTLTKHAIKCHCDEDKVLEKTFIWTKRKCSFCFRPLQYLHHYKDHMKFHNNPLPHFCHHLDCKQRFSTQQELKEHITIHQPFRPQCPFTDCERLFTSYQGLFDHEWRHYVPVPQKEELESAPSKQKQQSAEAPWKQRVKVEELWLQSKKVPREIENEVCETRTSNINQTLPTSDDGLVKTVSNECIEDSKLAINGYEDMTKKVMEELMSISHTAPAATTPSKKTKKKTDDWDIINVRDLEDVSTLAEGIQKNIGEPHITEHKTFKPEDPSYAPFVKTPFVRPPPSTYLDESVLSMRKRRSTDSPENPPKKFAYYTNKKKKELTGVKEQPGNAVAAEQKIRHRCDKCLSSFSSLEELQKHQALNTCSSLFGFDSDDEN